MIRSNFALQPRPTKPLTQDPVAIVLGYQEIAKKIKELEDLKQKHADEHIAQMNQNKKEHAAVLQELSGHVRRVADQITRIQKGNPGHTPRPGIDFEAPSKDEIVKDIMGKIRQPKDGDTPVINEDAIARKAAKLVKIPEPKIELPKIEIPTAEDIVKEIKEKELLTPDHIKGFRNEIASYRAQLAGKHYGKDTMVRGGGGSGSSSTTGFQVPTGTVDGSNKVFVFTTAPNAITVDGGRSMQKVSSDGTVNWTGTTTVTLSVAPTFDVFSTA